MPSQVTLTITEGNLKGQKFTFDTRTTCIIGRATDCHPQIPDDENHRTISRYHCLLDINPPDIRVRDFGSKNGTFVNGNKIGQREANQTPEEAAKLSFPEFDLKTGDEIKLSHTIFQVKTEIDPELEKTLKREIPLNQQKKPDLWQMIQGFLQQLEAGNQNLGTIKNYKILRELGRGGFSIVYLAQHKQTGEQVALKVMLKNNNKILPINEAVPMILQVLDGLEYAHNAEIPNVKLADGSFGKGRGLVHRDLKPGNIFVTNINGKNIVKVADYGLGKAFDQAGLSGLTNTGHTAGTPYFMPRQQVLDFKYPQRSVDVWAAAASLYYMLTANAPRNFSGQDPFLAVLQNDAVPVRDRNSAIPKPLADVIDLALVDNPEIYFKSAGEFKQVLLKNCPR
ncbi:FHA domain-containing protein [Kamptonema sp. UHCC 0994]|uniref:protein kinase domain-containing protein n=1 Tax=Kamptonema sp. UHCC 0994 TaxID=3031329 RepID=UPI0023B9988E|nr:FHA domain-containing protein [Kamptonema sp. UHCC 0994]MDF0551601.1 FHA domain-containing protein [Kamptonema sp. UHCC 0994]